MAQETRKIDVTTLVRPKQGDALGTPAETDRIKLLIQAIKRTVSPDSWDCVGGTGSLQSHFVEASPNGPRWYLIGFQSTQTLAEIERLVTEMST